ncbi:MAG TPA: hypothetical protein VMW75_16220, partial [Thermoanaerobaculia bacterium]|nr:hypothetical protein [Thermoanaerobaculia bacterium]
MTVWLLAGLARASGGPALAATASLVADLNTTPVAAGNGGHIVDMQALGSNFLFSFDQQLWGSDGTALGTRLIHDFCPSGTVLTCVHVNRFIGVVGGAALLLVVTDDRVPEIQLWASDGTAGGTRSLASELTPAPDTYTTSAETPFALTAHALYFFACGPGNCGLWKTDGTVAGTVAVAQGFGQPLLSIAAAGKRVFFGAVTAQSKQLWTSDGTPAGTLSLGSFPDYYDSEVFVEGLGPFFAAGPRVYFLAGDPTHHRQLWTSDGTVAGTKPLTAFTPADPFAHTSLVKAIGDRLYFVGDDGTHGDQLYVSDGSAAGTRAVTAFTAPNAFSSAPFLADDAGSLAEVAGKLLFVATDGIHPFGLWSSGGTPATTALLTGCSGGCPNLPAGTQLFAIGTHALFEVNDAAGDLSFWATDGSGAGTLPLGAPCSGCGFPQNPYVHSVAPFAGHALFESSTSAGDPAVWVTDGTAGGTRIL